MRIRLDCPIFDYTGPEERVSHKPCQLTMDGITTFYFGCELIACFYYIMVVRSNIILREHGGVLVLFGVIKITVYSGQICIAL